MRCRCHIALPFATDLDPRGQGQRDPERSTTPYIYPIRCPGDLPAALRGALGSPLEGLPETGSREDMLVSENAIESYW